MQTHSPATPYIYIYIYTSLIQSARPTNSILKHRAHTHTHSHSECLKCQPSDTHERTRRSSVFVCWCFRCDYHHRPPQSLWALYICVAPHCHSMHLHDGSWDCAPEQTYTLCLVCVCVCLCLFGPVRVIARVDVCACSPG